MVLKTRCFQTWKAFILSTGWLGLQTVTLNSQLLGPEGEASILSPEYHHRTSPSWLSPNSPPYKSHQEVYSICILKEHKLAVLSIYSPTLDKSVFCPGSAQSTGSDSAHKSTPHLGSTLELTPWLRTQFSQTWGQESWTSPHNLPCGGMDESEMPSPPHTVSPSADKVWPWSHKSGRASSKPNQWQHTREQILPPVWAVHWGWPYCLGCRWAGPGGMKATKLTHFPSSAIPEQRLWVGPVQHPPDLQTTGAYEKTNLQIQNGMIATTQQDIQDIQEQPQWEPIVSGVAEDRNLSQPWLWTLARKDEWTKEYKCVSMSHTTASQTVCLNGPYYSFQDKVILFVFVWLLVLFYFWFFF